MSYYIASKNKDGEYVGDMNLVDDLISKKKVMIISQKKDDIYFINLAIERNAYIITRDGFKEEREMYPGLDWEDIDNRTLKGHEFMGSDFILPGLPEHSAEIPMDISYAEFKLLSDKVEFLENKIQMIEDSQKIQSEATKDTVADFQPNEIVLSLLHSSLKGGTEITLNGFYEETLRAVLGHKRTKNSHTGKALRQKLGYSKSLGFLQWLVNLSNHKIQHRSNKGKVFIAKV